jgi:ATP-binding cassette subfamily F protein 3
MAPGFDAAGARAAPVRRRSAGDVDWLRFAGVTRHYGVKTVFEGLGGVLRDREKVGLVGGNGAGKSSLLRMLAGIDVPDGGEVVRASDARIGYLAQDATNDEATTLRDVLTGAFARIHEDEARLRTLERELSAAAEAGDAEREARLMRTYGDAREAFDRHGGEGLERQVRTMLAVFGFDEADLDRPTSAFSGGQRTRAALARILLEEPDVLLLDEPTNHLDIGMVRWLEDLLVDEPRACVLVSHDRYVLDRVCTQIWELDRGTLTVYETQPGRAYADYREQRETRALEAQRVYELALTEDKRQRAVIAELRTHGSHNYAQVRSRERQFEKLAAPEAPQRRDQRAIGVRLQSARRATGGIALAARELAKAYAEPLFAHLSFEVARGERLAIVGENGSGKSTLLKILAGLVAPDAGSVKISDGVRFAYFAQDSEAELDAGVTAVDAVLEAAPIVEQEARALLGRMGLGGEQADKPVEAFSGGERRRIMLARLMARSSDCLLLDEPTNDLDIQSREVLEGVLAEYAGAIVVVSHDRYLLHRIADRVLWLHDGVATMIIDGYDAFERLQRGEAAAPAPTPSETATARHKEQRLARDAAVAERTRKADHARRLAAAESAVARFDRRKAEIELEFTDPAIYEDQPRVAALSAELREVVAAATAALATWEELLESDERASAASSATE